MPSSPPFHCRSPLRPQSRQLNPFHLSCGQSVVGTWFSRVGLHRAERCEANEFTAAVVTSQDDQQPSGEERQGSIASLASVNALRSASRAFHDLSPCFAWPSQGSGRPLHGAYRQAVSERLDSSTIAERSANFDICRGTGPALIAVCHVRTCRSPCRLCV